MIRLSDHLSEIGDSLQPTLTETVPFGEWLPDLADYANPGATRITNVIPQSNGYEPFPDLSDQSNALTGEALGAFSATDTSNNVFVYAGDATKLYEMVDLTFTDESKGGGYSTAGDDVWEFELFGSTVVATNFTDPVQSIAAGGGAAGAFADLITSTNKPKAKHVAGLRQFLVLGNTSDATDGHVPNRVWWSAIRDAADFDPDATTQSDYEDLRQGGWVQRVVGGAEYGLIFQETQITRMEYVGSPQVFGFYPVDRSRGTPIPNSVIGHGRNVFFISEEGFFQFTGSQSLPIGANKVDKTFWRSFDIGNKRYVSASIDPVNKLVVWLFPVGASPFAPNKMFVYHWISQRWAEVDISARVLLRTKTQGYTLDGLDSISTNIDTGFTESFDSDAWKGGKLRFGAMDTADRLAYFTGGPLLATLDTTEAKLSPNRSLVTSIRPLVTGPDGVDLDDTITAAIGSRSRLQDQASFGSSAFIDADGACSVRSDARYHRARVIVIPSKTLGPGSWTHAQGVEISYVPTSAR